MEISKEEITNFLQDRKIKQNEIATIKQHLADAAEALCVFGEHDWDCNGDPCTCGLNAAIEKYRELSK